MSEWGFLGFLWACCWIGFCAVVLAAVAAAGALIWLLCRGIGTLL